MAERSSALDSSSDVVIIASSKAVGPVCCVMHVKKTRTLIVKEKGLAPVFLDSRLEHPAGWICVRYKSSVLLLLRATERARTENILIHRRKISWLVSSAN